MHDTIGKTLLNPISLGSVCSYELCGNTIMVRLFGLLPVQTIHLADVHYLRLAARDEPTTAYLLFNWPQLLPHYRSVSPVYVLQTHKRRRIFLKLNGRAHFKLRQAIGRQHEHRPQRIAA
ncbi:MAG: hypothetical protein DRP64_00995 [Verrucomicrobia bacterium]|nr:MAG: hypothetical protein DRP64_00995 [Verrucomicrobiota bacterium]